MNVVYFVYLTLPVGVYRFNLNTLEYAVNGSRKRVFSMISSSAIT